MTRQMNRSGAVQGPVSFTEDGVEAFPLSKKHVKALARARLVLQVLHLSTRVLGDMEA